MMAGLLMFMWATSHAPAQNSALEPVVAPVTKEAVAAPPMELHHPDPKVDALLDRLETADAGIRDLSGSLDYTRVNVVLDDIQTRIGTLRFVVVPAVEGVCETPRRVFLVHFTFFTDGFVQRNEDEQWGFDGQWLYERSARQKTRIVRQIAREGENLDPLRLGEGPLPIPLGQRKAEILTRYDVTLRPVQEGLDGQKAGAFAKNVKGATQLHLRPLRAGEQFDEVRLWYRDDAQGRLLPVLARSARLDDHGEEIDIAYVQLSGVKVNTGMKLGDVAVEPVPAGAGWQEKTEALDEEIAQGDSR